MLLEQLGTHIPKNQILNQKFKNIKLIIERESYMNFLEENIAEHIHYLDLGKDFLNMTQKA